MPPKYENQIAIIGSGIVGICSAIELQEKGLQVTLIDPNDPGQVTSYGNAGVVSPWSCIPQSLPGLWKSVPKWLLDPEGPLAIHWLYAPRLLPWLIRFLKAGDLKRVEQISKALISINHPSVTLYKNLLKGTGQENLIRDSCYLHVYRDPSYASPNNIAWRIRQERGVPLRFLKKGEIQEVEPEISTKIEAAVLIERQGRTTNPGRLGKVLFEKAMRLGVKFLRQTVSRLNPEPDGIYRLISKQGDILSKNIIIAAGAWSAELLQTIGVYVPLEAERGYHLIFSEPGISLENSIMDGDKKFVVSSMEMGVRSAGTAEFSGLHSKPNFDRARIFKSLTRELLPNLDTSVLEEWAGVRPSLPDTLPCVGKVPGHPNIIAAFGHSHLGLTQAPMTARIVSAIAMQTPLNIDIKPFGMERFK